MNATSHFYRLASPNYNACDENIGAAALARPPAANYSGPQNASFPGFFAAKDENDEDAGAGKYPIWFYISSTQSKMLKLSQKEEHSGMKTS